tara:strand:+ start:5613 stop:6830 length:1218 start_codon:yes stop_codon:yes gene_type:complete
MTRLVILILFAVIFRSNSFCQLMLPIQQDTTLFNRANELVLSAIGNYQSSSIGKDITKSFFYGGFINEYMKAETSARQQLINRFGIDLNSEVEYRNHKSKLCKDSTKSFLLKYGIYNFSAIKYTEDVFDVLFYGNSSFIGDTALLTGSRFDSYAFQKIGFGWFDRYSKSSITLNAIGVNNMTSGRIDNGTIFQSASIDSIGLSINANYNQSNTRAFCGFGFALDIDYRFNMRKNTDEKIYFQLLMRNLGVVCLPKVRSYSINSNLNYHAYSIDELLNASTVFDDPEEALGLFVDSSSYRTNWKFLPTLFQFTKLIDRNSVRKIQGFYGARAYLSSSFMPMFFSGIDYHPVKWYRIGLQVSYGGFSNLCWGMYSALKFNRFSLGIASENLFSKTGESIILRISCLF